MDLSSKSITMNISSTSYYLLFVLLMFIEPFFFKARQVHTQPMIATMNSTASTSITADRPAIAPKASAWVIVLDVFVADPMHSDCWLEVDISAGSGLCVIPGVWCFVLVGVSEFSRSSVIVEHMHSVGVFSGQFDEMPLCWDTYTFKDSLEQIVVIIAHILPLNIITSCWTHATLAWLCLAHHQI